MWPLPPTKRSSVARMGSLIAVLCSSASHGATIGGFQAANEEPPSTGKSWEPRGSSQETRSCSCRPESEVEMGTTGVGGERLICLQEHSVQLSRYLRFEQCFRSLQCVAYVSAYGREICLRVSPGRHYHEVASGDREYGRTLTDPCAAIIPERPRHPSAGCNEGALLSIVKVKRDRDGSPWRLRILCQIITEGRYLCRSYRGPSRFRCLRNHLWSGYFKAHAPCLGKRVLRFRTWIFYKHFISSYCTDILLLTVPPILPTRISGIDKHNACRLHRTEYLDGLLRYDV